MATRAFLQTLCTPSPQALIASAVLDWRLGRRGGSAHLLRGQRCNTRMGQAMDGRCHSRARPRGRAQRLRACRDGRRPRMLQAGAGLAFYLFLAEDESPPTRALGRSLVVFNLSLLPGALPLALRLRLIQAAAPMTAVARPDRTHRACPDTVRVRQAGLRS